MWIDLRKYLQKLQEMGPKNVQTTKIKYTTNSSPEYDITKFKEKMQTVILHTPYSPADFTSFSSAALSFFPSLLFPLPFFPSPNES